MSSLPQIFAPQPANPPALSRAVAPEAAQEVTAKPVRARGDESRGKQSDTQGTDRGFDDAMSEQTQAKSAKEDVTPKGAANATDKKASVPTDKPSEEKPAREASADSVSELMFSEMFAATATSTPAKADATPETDAKPSSPTAPTTNPTADLAADQSPTPRLEEIAEIKTPLPEDVASLTGEDVPTEGEAKILTDIPEVDPKTPTQMAEVEGDITDVKIAASAEADVKAQTSQGDTLAEPASDPKLAADIESVDPTVKVAAASTSETAPVAEARVEVKPQASSTETPPPADTSLGSKVSAERSVSNSVESVKAQTAPAETGANAKSAAPAQPDVQADTQPDSETPRRAPKDAETQFLKTDIETPRSDRAASVSAAASENFADLDRVGPTSPKPLTLSALADTVSVPGLNHALSMAAPQSALSGPIPGMMNGPLAGLNERLAASLLQNAQMNPTSTIEKLPQAVVAVALGSRSATIQIDPPELGRIQLDYQFDSQGRTVVTLTPESEAARTALVDRMASITTALEQGTSSGVDVKLGNTQDFGTAFSEASDGEAGERESAPASDSAPELSAGNDSLPPMSGHHIAADGTARLHIRV